MGSSWQIIGALLLVASAGFLIASLVQLRQEWLSRNWPTAEGYVTATQIKVYESDGNLSADRYEGAIHYRYAIDGHSYTGCSIVPASYHRNKQQQILAAYPVDRQIVVAYHPHSWSRSTISPGKLQYRDLIFSMTVIGIALALITAS